MSFLSAVELVTNIKMRVHRANAFSDLIVQMSLKIFLGVHVDQLTSLYVVSSVRAFKIQPPFYLEL